MFPAGGVGHLPGDLDGRGVLFAHGGLGGSPLHRAVAVIDAPCGLHVHLYSVFIAMGFLPNSGWESMG
jgi:hypothetical protein